MKFRKSIIVTSLASVMAVSMVGAITGTVAWYQYSTRATVSMIGMNVAETGILEISTTSATDGFKRDLSSADILAAAGRTNFNMTPVTWGVNANQAATALPANAYKNPDVVNKVVKSDGSDYASRGTFANAWDAATAAKDYIQFNMWIRARTVDNVSGGFTQTAEDVYMTDYILANIGSGLVMEALRFHLAIDYDGVGGADTNILFSKTAKAGIPLAGNLDQDNDGVADRVGGYEWAQHRDDTITYGAVDGEGNPYTQTTVTLDSKKATRDSENNYAIAAGDSAKKLFTTPTTGATKITVTIWIEGWENSTGLQKTGVTKYSFDAGVIKDVDANVEGLYKQYKLGDTLIDNNYVLMGTGAKADGTSKYYTRSSDTIVVADWSGQNTDGAAFQFGLTFDVGRDAFKD